VPDVAVAHSDVAPAAEPAATGGSVAVLVVTYGSAELLDEHLATLRLTGPRDRVVVIDNWHSAAQRDAVARRCRAHGWDFLPMPGNEGFGAGMNAGARWALERGADVLVLANPDLTVDGAVVDDLAADVRRDPMQLVAPAIVRPDGTAWSTDKAVDLRTGDIVGVPDVSTAGSAGWLSGACLAVHRNLWTRIGGFDPAYFLYWEDVDLSRRAIDAGARLRVRHDLSVVHDVGGTQGGDHAGSSKSPVYVRSNCRNRLRFAAAHLPAGTRLRWAALTPAASWRILLRGGGRRGLLRAPRSVLAAVGGSLAGLILVAGSFLPRRSRHGPVRPADRPVRVLQSFPAPRPTTNPYLVQLLGSLPEGFEVSTFTWRRALIGQVDVFHVHWPERLLRGSTSLRTVARQLITLAVLLRFRLTGTAIVRTAHNERPHEQGGWRERTLLRMIDRATRVTVRLSGPAPADPSVVLVPHGHYRDWHPPVDASLGQPGALLFFGLVRPYKGVLRLLAAFQQLPGNSLRLRVVGAASDPVLAAEVRAAAARDPRVSCRLCHVDDEELRREVATAELVVLPYTEMGNSGAALLALSLDRPVLVPASAATEELNEEVGPGWVFTYDGPLDSDVLAAALDKLHRSAASRSARPDLSARDWPTAGRRHAEAYRRAVALARG
jgi:GT2 family glycosyltransferase